MQEETAMTETKGNALSTNTGGGLSSEFSKDDIQQGRLSVMQANSKLVKSEDARLGAVINLVDHTELAYKGNKTEPAKDLEFMIFGFLKYWIVKDDDTDEFVEKFPANSANELPWEENVDGRNLKRTYHFSYMVLIPEEIKDGVEMPYELAFRSTSVKDTKRLNSLIQRMEQKGVMTYQKVFKASVVEKSKDSNTWYGLDLGIARDASEEEAKACQAYFNNFVESKNKFYSDQKDHYGEAEKSNVDNSEY
jgi:hypothetical protein